MDVSIKVDGLDACGNHIRMTVTAARGGNTRTFPLTLTRGELTLDDLEPEQIAAVLLKNFVKESGLQWGAQLRNAIEAKVWKL